MIRQNIILGDYTYIIDLYKYNIDFTSEAKHKKFVMLRNFNIINNVSSDTDIYFIEKDIVEKCIDETTNIVDYSKLSNYIAFPNLSNSQLKHKSFSNSILDFNDNYNSLNFTYDIDIYRLFNNDKDEYYIPCDKVRIYHPTVKNNLNALIYIDNYINDIHFHYLCIDYNSYETNSETELNIDHSFYSEYIELYIPNIETLFGGNVYFKENVNAIYDNDTLVIDNFIPLSLLLNPFKIDLKDSINVKNYVPLALTIKNNFLTVPINITLFPYSEIDSKTHLYLIDSDLEANTDIFTIDTKFEIKSKFGFDNGKISVISEFNYPGTNVFEHVYDAYYFYYNTCKDDYSGELSDEIFDNDMFPTKTIKYCGYVIQIATDYNFKNVIYHYEIDPITSKYYNEAIDNFSFQLNGIFTDWDSYNGSLIVRTLYVDKIQSNVIESNYLTLDKEVFKYIINDISANRVSNLDVLQKIYRDNEDMDLSYFNFIDKINCVVNKTETTSSVSNTLSTPKILYKPIFYKVVSAQNIKIRQNLTQNIGVNLSDYMTKVETFKMIIGDLEYEETGRNDIYVIFKIDASSIVDTEGTYDILNQDNEYITDGNYTIY